MSFNSHSFILLVSMTLSTFVVAQQEQMDSTTFRLFAEIGGGYSYKISSSKYSIGSTSRDGVSGTFRLKWGSSNLLGVGIETGWLPISSTSNSAVPSEFGPIDVSASLTAIPIIAIFSMQRMGVQLHTGFGYYHVMAKANVMGSIIESSEWDLGFLLALGMARPLSDNIRIGGEVKWNNILEQQISVVSIQLRILYKVFGE